MADSVGEQDLRAEIFDKVLKNFALEEFKMLPVCKIIKTSGWINTYFQETAADLTGGTGSAVKGIPRLANFPYGQVTWTEVNERVTKYGMDGIVSYEDAKTDEVDVLSRTALRIARAVANAVDDAVTTELATTTNTAAAGATWDNAVVALRDPVADILAGIAAMQTYNFDPISSGKGFIALHPNNYKELMLSVRGDNNYFSEEVVGNGKVQKVCGVKIIVSNGATENTVLMGISGEAMIWYEAASLSTKLIEDPGVKYTCRAWQVGVPVLANNYAAYKITSC